MYCVTGDSRGWRACPCHWQPSETCHYPCTVQYLPEKLNHRPRDRSPLTLFCAQNLHQTCSNYINKGVSDTARTEREPIYINVLYCLELIWIRRTCFEYFITLPLQITNMLFFSSSCCFRIKITRRWLYVSGKLWGVCMCSCFLSRPGSKYHFHMREESK